ncbi:MAG: hypothetical protein IT378_06220 [Sandaracinaceae bacterium]|nr:hypothetical protein [Sandaracinaceae bacterium]
MRALAALLVIASGASGCAPAGPVLAGGRTTPRERSDVALGAAVRVPVTDLVPPAAGDARELTSFGAPGGATPLALVRYGLSDQVELGVESLGAGGRLTLRAQLPSEGMLRLLVGLAPEAAAVWSEPREGTQGGSAFRGGVSLPILLAIDVLSLFEVWLGPRWGALHVAGDSAGRAVSLTGMRTGGVVGLAVGFRRVHVMVELAVDHEYWTGHLASAYVERHALVLTPAFAVRLRL